MNKLLALSVALLIGCSPATPDESEITIGRQEKATTYPIPLGIWKSDSSGTTLDFTGLAYDGRLDLGEDFKIKAELKTVWASGAEWDQEGKRGGEITSKKGYWHKRDDNIYVGHAAFGGGEGFKELERAFAAANKVVQLLYSFKIDRGSLIDEFGNRWYKQKEDR